jgi:DNA-binding transcriptional LysR family regulator
MRFDLVDLQLFIAVADARSITGGAPRAHLALASARARIKGLETAFGAALLKRGRRGVELTAAGESLLDHARIVMHNVEAMRGDLAAYATGVRASVLLLANTSGLSEHLPRALAAFLREHPDIGVDIEERESTDIAAAIATGAADLGFAAEHALPDNVERFLFSEDRLMPVASRRGDLGNRSDRLPGGDQPRLRWADGFDRVAGPHLKTRRAARRATAISGTVARFRCDLPDGRGGCRRCRRAGNRGEA